MYQKVKAYVEKHHMLAKGDKVIVGVSGGADSVCLLFMLKELGEELDLSVVAVHVHHGLRGEAADADERYVQQLCEKHQIPLQCFRRDVKEYAEQNRMGEEEAGRNIRREIFLQVLEDEQADHIALAHHKNDNVETFLWNLSRGTGINGAGGIRPMNGKWIRPLLCVKRDEIENYLKDEDIVWCIDETNQENNYVRNRIRNQMIPFFEEHVNGKTVEHMAEAIDQFSLLNEYIRTEVKKYQDGCVERTEDSILLKKAAFENVPAALRTHLLHNVLEEAAGQKKDIAAVHVKLLEELLEKQVGRKVDLPYEVTAARCYDGIELSQSTKEEQEQEISVEMRVFPREAGRITFPENPYTKWFDYDIIKCAVKLRHREPGDYITVHQDGGRKKLKQFFIDEKIPQKQRDHIWLAADDKHIMWVVGYRQNQAYQITENTKNILEIRVNGGKRDGRNS